METMETTMEATIASKYNLLVENAILSLKYNRMIFKLNNTEIAQVKNQLISQLVSLLNVACNIILQSIGKKLVRYRIIIITLI